MTATSIILCDGSYLDLAAPNPNKINIQIVAHALANICRFTGHVRQHYSVAQHSVLVAAACPRIHWHAALLHDAAEAFIGDVSRPLKKMLPDYKRVEEQMEQAVATAFAIPVDWLHHDAIRLADNQVCYTEKRDLLPANGHQWVGFENVAPLREKIIPWSPRMAEKVFLHAWFHGPFASNSEYGYLAEAA